MSPWTRLEVYQLNLNVWFQLRCRILLVMDYFPGNGQLPADARKALVSGVVEWSFQKCRCKVMFSIVFVHLSTCEFYSMFPWSCPMFHLVVPLGPVPWCSSTKPLPGHFQTCSLQDALKSWSPLCTRPIPTWDWQTRMVDLLLEGFLVPVWSGFITRHFKSILTVSCKTE